MTQRVAAAETCPQERVVVVREFDQGRDTAAVEEMEKRCEIGQKGKPSLVTDLMGDPLCRVRHFSSHVMLVAEYGEEERRIVGVVRGCIKTVTRSKNMYVKVAYILGLRVCPSHRRLGIGTKLVQRLETWCQENGAEYAYMATDCTNHPSVNLFTKKCSYSKFRTPIMLVQPVHAHHVPRCSSKTLILPVPPPLATSLYRRIFEAAEFFPTDIDQVLTNMLNLGTFMAIPRGSGFKWEMSFDENGFVPPPAFAVMSVWNTKEVFKLQLKGASPATYAWCSGTRALDVHLPWLRLPSIPNVFKQFGVYFLYGLHMEGKHGAGLMRSLCAFAHNMARDDDGCGAVVAELGQRDPVRCGVPHWTRLSWPDLWCIKKFTVAEHGNDDDDWAAAPPTSPVIFVDPRDC